VLPHSIRLLNQGELSRNHAITVIDNTSALVELLLCPRNSGYSVLMARVFDSHSLSVWSVYLFLCFTPPFVFVLVRSLLVVVQSKLILSATGVNLPQNPIILDVCIYFADIVEWDILLLFIL
jgi:hypothetical protein